MKKNYFIKLMSLAGLVFLYAIIYKIYIPRVNAFGCFDDCFNFMGGYFLLKGRHIYSDFFFNHQPFAAYISFIIQYFTHPQSIFELVLRHRQFMLFFGFIFNVILFLRFGVKTLIFIIIFEFSKFYLFGDRFLAEGMVVYPLVYLTGLVLLKATSQKLLSIDYFLSAIFVWFVIFSREPYVPLAIFLFILIAASKKITGNVKLSTALLITLSVVTFFAFNIKDYIFNVFTINYQIVLPAEANTKLIGGPLQIIFYPLFILISSAQNIFKSLLLEIDIVFLVFYSVLLKQKRFYLSAIIFLILALSNLRPELAGKEFYEAYHEIVFYSLFIFITIFIIFSNMKNKSLFLGGLLSILVIFIVFITSPLYFIREKVNEQAEFLTNYGQNLQEGEVVKALSNPSDTLFLDGSDDLDYFQAQRSSLYKYTWYTSVMPKVGKYRAARIEMFKNYSPDFYRDFGFCATKVNSLPSFVKSDYIRLTNDGKPSCLYINKRMMSKISANQLRELALWHYSISK